MKKKDLAVFRSTFSTLQQEDTHSIFCQLKLLYICITEQNNKFHPLHVLKTKSGTSYSKIYYSMLYSKQNMATCLVRKYPQKRTYVRIYIILRLNTLLFIYTTAPIDNINIKHMPCEYITKFYDTPKSQVYPVSLLLNNLLYLTQCRIRKKNFASLFFLFKFDVLEQNYFSQPILNVFLPFINVHTLQPKQQSNRTLFVTLQLILRK